MITKGSWYVTSGLPHQTQPTYFPVPFSLSFPPLYVHGRTGDYGVFWQFNHYWPKPKRSKVLSEIYPKFAKSLIQIAGPKNIQRNVNPFSRPDWNTADRLCRPTGYEIALTDILLETDARLLLDWSGLIRSSWSPGTVLIAHSLHFLPV